MKPPAWANKRDSWITGILSAALVARPVDEDEQCSFAVAA
jgi:hypothetical protein